MGVSVLRLSEQYSFICNKIKEVDYLLANALELGTYAEKLQQDKLALEAIKQTLDRLTLDRAYDNGQFRD